MSDLWLSLRITICTVAFSYWGIHLLSLGGAAMFGGPGEPPSYMTFDEFWVRSASGQWLRDQIDSFIMATVFLFAACVVVALVASPREFYRLVAPRREGPTQQGRFVLGLKILLICAGLLSCVGVYVRLGNQTDYGGNTAALAACRSLITGLELVSHERKNEPVSISDIKPSELRYVTNVAGLHLLGDARILVKPAKVTFFRGPNEIVVVCDRAFDNVPRRLFGRAPYTHAVAYRDGSTRLLTVDEFRGLALTNFVDLRTLQTKSIETGDLSSEL